MEKRTGSLYVIGIGPGAPEHLTPRALEAISKADLVVGYSTYIKLVAHLLGGKDVVKTGMTEEIGRARAAVERAKAGDTVALISSGDAGVYGMAGLVFEVLDNFHRSNLFCLSRETSFETMRSEALPSQYLGRLPFLPCPFLAI